MATDPNAPAIPPLEARDTYLSPEERQKLRRLLGHPTDYPRELSTWLTEFIAVHGLELSVSQLRGWSRVVPYLASEAQSGVRSVTAYGDLTSPATPGPVLEGISAGAYLLGYGAYLSGTFYNAQGAMAPQFNDEEITGDAEAAVGYSIPNAVRFIARSLTEPNNTITMKYRWIGGAASDIVFENRWLFALRIGN